MVAVQHKSQKTGDIAALLLAHYDVHARALPWRSPPRTPPLNPYRVWLSEVMLQQTTVAAVIPYFESFTARWPDFAALASAPEEDVMAAWAGLGYYSRARNLVKCARAVAADHGGKLPDSHAELLKLPGVGAYTAAAIAAIAFGERVAVVDANIERVAARLFAITTPLPAARPAIREAVDAITPSERPGDFAQAMMDLGATLCTVRKPGCLACPLRQHCVGHAQGIAESLPVKAAKAAKPQRIGTAYWVEHDDKVWLVKRPGTGMLGGMRALPDDGWAARRDGDSRPPIVAEWRILNEAVAHVFTHFSLTLSVALTVSSAKPEPLGEGEWWPVKSLDSAGLPTVFAKAAKLAISASEEFQES